jgi:hypothetical protein
VTEFHVDEAGSGGGWQSRDGRPVCGNRDERRFVAPSGATYSGCRLRLVCVPQHRGRHPLRGLGPPPLSIHGFADSPVALCRHPLRGLASPCAPSSAIARSGWLHQVVRLSSRKRTWQLRHVNGYTRKKESKRSIGVRLRDRRILSLPQRGHFLEKRIAVAHIRESQLPGSSNTAERLKHA